MVVYLQNKKKKNQQNQELVIVTLYIYLFDAMTLNQNQLQISGPLGTLCPVHVTGMILVLRKMEQ